MFRLWSIIKSIILWSYERGTWQYDIMVVLILAFVFFTPNNWFEPGNRKDCDRAAVYVDATELMRSEQPQATVEELLTVHLRKKQTEGVRITRIEPKLGSDSRIQGYCVWVSQ